jgi:multidrug resistance efflux pump
MRFLGFVAAVALIVVLGLVIDAYSRVGVVRPTLPAPDASSIYARGRVEGATPEVELKFRLTGCVEKVLVRENELVRPGQVLVQLEDEHYRQEIALAEADVTVAEAQLERLLNGAHPKERLQAAAMLQAKQAELDKATLFWQRISELSQSKAISQQEADNHRAQVASMTAEVEAAKAKAALLEEPARNDDVRIEKARIAAAKARLQLAKVQLQYTRLTAPTAGRVLKVDVEAGELVGPTSEKPAVILADTSRWHVRAFVEEMDAPRLRVGMTAKAAFDGIPDRKFSGRIVRLSPRMGRKELWSDRPTERLDTKTREVWIELEPSESLVVGLRGDVTIDPASGPASRVGP